MQGERCINRVKGGPTDVPLLWGPKSLRVTYLFAWGRLLGDPKYFLGSGINFK